jgi:hypothetical protein
VKVDSRHGSFVPTICLHQLLLHTVANEIGFPSWSMWILSAARYRDNYKHLTRRSKTPRKVIRERQVIYSDCPFRYYTVMVRFLVIACYLHRYLGWMWDIRNRKLYGTNYGNLVTPISTIAA